MEIYRALAEVQTPQNITYLSGDKHVPQQATDICHASLSSKTSPEPPQKVDFLKEIFATPALLADGPSSGFFKLPNSKSRIWVNQGRKGDL